MCERKEFLHIIPQLGGATASTRQAHVDWSGIRAGKPTTVRPSCSQKFIRRLAKRLRVAAYARIAETKGNIPASLSAQVSYYNQMTTSNPDWEFAGVYADAGVSGTSTARPRFQDLLTDCDQSTTIPLIAQLLHIANVPHGKQATQNGHASKIYVSPVQEIASGKFKNSGFDKTYIIPIDNKSLFICQCPQG